MKPATMISRSDNVPYPKAAFYSIICLGFMYLYWHILRGSISHYLRDLHAKLYYSRLDYQIYVLAFHYGSAFFGGVLGDFLLGNFRSLIIASSTALTMNILLFIIIVSDKGNCAFCPEAVIFLITYVMGPSISIAIINLKAIACQQFVLPNHSKELRSFFSYDYIVLSIAAMLLAFYTKSYILNLRTVHTWILDQYKYVIFLNFILLLICSCIICFPIKNNKKESLRRSSAVAVVKCICYSTGMRLLRCIKLKKKVHRNKRKYWLRYAYDKYKENTILESEIVICLSILVIPYFLYDVLNQYQVRSWEVLSCRMNSSFGTWGSINVRIIHFIFPLLTVVLIPIFDNIIYPAMKEFNLPLQKIFFGEMIIGLSVAFCAFVQYSLDSKRYSPPENEECRMQLYNVLDCNIRAFTKGNYIKSIKPLDYLTMEDIDIKVMKDKPLNLTITDCFLTYPSWNGPVSCIPMQVTSYVIFNSSDSNVQCSRLSLPQNEYFIVNRHINIRLIYHIRKSCNVSFQGDEVCHSTYLKSDNFSTPLIILQGFFDKSILLINGKSYGRLNIPPGTVHTLIIIEENNGQYKFNIIQHSPPGKVHTLWLLPAIIVVVVGDLMFDINYAHFVYEQAPLCLKTMSLSARYLSSFIRVIWLECLNFSIFTDKGSEYIFNAGILSVFINTYSVIFFFSHVYYEPYLLNGEEYY